MYIYYIYRNVGWDSENSFLFSQLGTIYFENNKYNATRVQEMFTRARSSLSFAVHGTLSVPYIIRLARVDLSTCQIFT